MDTSSAGLMRNTSAASTSTTPTGRLAPAGISALRRAKKTTTSTAPNTSSAREKSTAIALAVIVGTHMKSNPTAR